MHVNEKGGGVNEDNDNDKINNKIKLSHYELRNIKNAI